MPARDLTMHCTLLILLLLAVAPLAVHADCGSGPKAPAKCQGNVCLVSCGRVKVNTPTRTVLLQTECKPKPEPKCTCPRTFREVSTFSGSDSLYLDGPAHLARFSSVSGMVQTPDGTIYVADSGNRVIRKVQNNSVSLFAGTKGAYGFADGPALQSQFKSPSRLLLESDGSILVADSGNHRIRRIRNGQVSTIAGSSGGYQDGPALQAQFYYPRALAFFNGSLFIVDSYNNRIRVLRDGIVSTVAGEGSRGSTDGPAATATFDIPSGIVISSDGTIFVCGDDSNKIRRVFNGTVSTVTGAYGFKDGTLEEARFLSPFDLVMDANGTLFVADHHNQRIRKVEGNQVTTVAGTGDRQYEDGPLTSAKFQYVRALALANDGSLLVADHRNIRQIKNGRVDTIVGDPATGFRDGPIDQALFNTPREIAIGQDDSLYIWDIFNFRIRRIRNGVVETVAGSGIEGFADGPALSAKFNQGGFLVVDGNDLIIVEQIRHRIRRLSNGVVSTIAGTYSGYQDGDASSARFKYPNGAVVDSQGTIIVLDGSNHCLRQIKGSQVTTLAGSNEKGNQDGALSQARFEFPSAIAMAQNGTIYVSDRGGVRRVENGSVTTLSSMRFYHLIMSPDCTLLGVYSNSIYRIDSVRYERIIGGGHGLVNGSPSEAQFRDLDQIVMASDGSIYATDSQNHRIRKVV